MLPMGVMLILLCCKKHSEIPHYHIFCNVFWQIVKLATFWQKEKFCLQIWYLFLFLQLFTMLSSFHPEFPNHGNFFFFWWFRHIVCFIILANIMHSIPWSSTEIFLWLILRLLSSFDLAYHLINCSTLCIPPASINCPRCSVMQMLEILTRGLGKWHNHSKYILWCNWGYTCICTEKSKRKLKCLINNQELNSINTYLK